jgi:uncharacterized membrane protein YidH (DUF202 family)
MEDGDDLEIDSKEGDSSKKELKRIIQNERTRAAFERLQLAWVRTSLTLMGIGIGAFEYYHARIEAGKTPFLHVVTGSQIGISLILIGGVMMLLSSLQHLKSMAELKKQYAEMRFSLAIVVSFVVLLFGLFLFTLVIFRL